VTSAECFDEYGPLYTDYQENDEFQKFFPMPNMSQTGPFVFEVLLPEDLECEQCVLQWTWTTGNRWGVSEDGEEGLGCGPQETFRGCADVSVLP